MKRLSRLGRYVLLEELGGGGFGTVYKARDSHLDRFVAIKIPKSNRADPQFSEMFMREARAAAQLHHPGIVSVYDFGRADECVFIVSEFIEGTTLASYLTQGRLPYEKAVRLVIELANALHYAHESRIIHRDLKPQNILIDTKGSLHIADFGLAKREVGEITIELLGIIRTVELLNLTGGVGSRRRPE